MIILPTESYNFTGDSKFNVNVIIAYQSHVIRILHKSLRLGYKLSYSGAAFIIDTPTDKFVIRAKPLSWDGDYMWSLNSIEGMIDERLAPFERKNLD